MSKYTDDDIRNKSKITCQIAGDYLGISANAVSLGKYEDKEKKYEGKEDFYG